MTLVEFLLARITEDEDEAKAAEHKNGSKWTVDPFEDGGARINGTVDRGANPRAYSGDRELWDDETALGMWLDTAMHVVRWDPARVLAECETKRAIIELWQQTDADDRVAFNEVEAEKRVSRQTTLWSVLKLLALPFAGHPDYREEWRP